MGGYGHSTCSLLSPSPAQVHRGTIHSLLLQEVVVPDDQQHTCPWEHVRSATSACPHCCPHHQAVACVASPASPGLTSHLAFSWDTLA